MTFEHLKLMHSKPPPEIEQAILRIHNDAQMLRERMTAGQVRSADVILEHARDCLSAVLERGRIEQ